MHRWSRRLELFKFIIIITIAPFIFNGATVYTQEKLAPTKSDTISASNVDSSKIDSSKIDTTPLDSVKQISNHPDTVKKSSTKKEISLDIENDDIFADVDTSLSDFAVADSGKPAPPGFELLYLSSKKDKSAYFDTTHSIHRVIPQSAFQVGETLVFNIRYGVIVAGTATMSIPDYKKINNQPCYHIVTEAKSNRFFSAFYKVRDRVESFMDRDGLFTWRYEKHLREGKFRANQFVEYDQVSRLAITDKRDTLRIPPCVQDILTTFYYLRTLPLEVGKSLFVDNHADKKLYPLEIKVHKRDHIKVKAGEFDCIIVEPMLRSDAIFKQRGRLLVWLTDDSRRIPVQMKSKVLIGSITAELKKFEGVIKPNAAVKISHN